MKNGEGLKKRGGVNQFNWGSGSVTFIPTWRFIFNNRAASMHAALVHRWHLHIIEDLIDDDDQDDGQQPNHQGMLNASQLKHSTIILV